MAKEVEGIGKTYEEAVKDGLSKIGLSKDKVVIELVEEPKKRFFSILERRDIKVKLIEKEETGSQPKVEKKEEESVEYTQEEINHYQEKAEQFIRDFVEKMGIELDISIAYEDSNIKVDLNGEKAGLIIGYRGETLDALQILTSTIVNRNEIKHIHVIVDAESYRKKRIKTLEELALKVANTVIAKRKSVTLEPMIPFERRIIHTTLQDHPKVKSSSVGEEPYRKVVISLK